jgi:hypothetical protein
LRPFKAYICVRFSASALSALLSALEDHKMTITKLSIAVLAAGLFAGACSSNEQPIAEQFPAQAPLTEPADAATIDDYWAKDNLDLQRVGVLLERAESPEQFETYLNDDEYGVNNLDLNGDGYVDYVSVREFGDDGRGQRGLSLYTRFGADLIQDIATIYFYRDNYEAPGSRVLIYGNDRIYGDDHYYETNWADRTVQIVSALFGDNNYYQSPYYYDNYPDWYDPYYVVEPQYYRTRVVELYPQPGFVLLNAPPVYYSNIKIKSPNNGLHLGQIKARLVKPSKDQEDFLKANPARPKFAKMDNSGKPEKPEKMKDTSPGRSDDAPRGNPGNPKAGNPKGDNPNAGNPKGGDPNAGKPAKEDNPKRGNDDNPGQGSGKGKGKGKP